MFNKKSWAKGLAQLFLNFTRMIYASINSVKNTSPGGQLCIDFSEGGYVIGECLKCYYHHKVRYKSNLRV